MKKTVVAVLLVFGFGLVIAGASALSAQADTGWDALKAGLESSNTFDAPDNLSAEGSSSDTSIVINGDKTVNFHLLTSIQAEFDGPIFFIAAGSTLTINGDSFVMTAADGQPVFGGSGAVQLEHVSVATFAGGSSVFGNQGGSVIGPVATVDLVGPDLTATGAMLDLWGTLEGDIVVGAGSSVILDQSSHVDASSLIEVRGALTNNTYLNGSGAFTVFARAVFYNNEPFVSSGVFSVNTGGVVNDTAGLQLSGALQNQGTITTANGSSLAMAGSSSNSGTIGGYWSITVANGALANSGTIVPASNGVVTGTITGNNYTISFAPDAARPAIPSLTVYAHDLAVAGVKILVPDVVAGAPVFAAWQTPANTIFDDTTPLTGSITLHELDGTFSTDTPVVGEPFAGYTTAAPDQDYQWSVGGTDIPMATSPTVTPTTAGQAMTLLVETTFPSGYLLITQAVSQTFGATLATFTTAPPVVAGLPAAGSTLVADATGSFVPGVSATTYEWFRSDGSGWDSIGTGSTLVLGSADVGHSVQVVAHGTLAGYVAGTADATVGPVAAAPLITTTSDELQPGDSLTIMVPGLEPSAGYTVELHSTPVVLGTAVTTSAGLLTGSFTIPAGTSPGTHQVVVVDGNGNPVAAITITLRATTTAATVLAYTGASEVLAIPVTGAIGLLVVGVLLLRRRRIASPSDSVGCR